MSFMHAIDLATNSAASLVVDVDRESFARFSVDPLPILLDWNRSGERRRIRRLEPGHYLLADPIRIREALTSTSEPFEARSAPFGRVASWVPGSAPARRFGAILARHLEEACGAISKDEIREQLLGIIESGASWPNAAAQMYVRLLGPRLFPGASPGLIRRLGRAIEFGHESERPKGAWFRLMHRIAHSRGEAAFWHWGSSRRRSASEGFERALFDTFQSDDDVALALHGIATTVCRGNALALSWTLLLDHGWRPTTAARATLRPLARRDPAAHRAREAMRLWPLAWTLPRTVRQPVHLEGLRLSPGDQLSACTFLLHRDPDIWHDPDDYKPERWNRPPSDYRDAYLPYGTGPGGCIGARFVQAMTVRVLDCWAELPACSIETIDDAPALTKQTSPPRFVIRPT